MSLVTLKVSIHGLRERLLLPDDAKIVSAGTVHHYSAAVNPEADELVLTVDMPQAPDGAVAVESIYTHTGHRDPMEFERFAWRAADGSEIKPDADESSA